VKYGELFKILQRDGWMIIRKKGSHVIMTHPLKANQLTVPYHAGREVKKGLLKALLKQAEVKTDKR
jgi:predicted RNA binding protein YcfA (HicA-like mRNA interferase family)